MADKDEPHMHDPADKELHTDKRTPPYPPPNKAKVVGKPVDDEESKQAWKKGKTQDAP